MSHLFSVPAAFNSMFINLCFILKEDNCSTTDMFISYQIMHSVKLFLDRLSYKRHAVKNKTFVTKNGKFRFHFTVINIAWITLSCCNTTSGMSRTDSCKTRLAFGVQSTQSAAIRLAVSSMSSCPTAVKRMSVVSLWTGIWSFCARVRILFRRHQGRFLRG
jgi:hypothetical protein